MNAYVAQRRSSRFPAKGALAQRDLPVMTLERSNVMTGARVQ